MATNSQDDPEYIYSVDGETRGQERFSVIAELVAGGEISGKLAFSGDGEAWEDAEIYDGVLTTPFIRPAPPRPDPPAYEPQMLQSLAKREYKVLSQKDRWFSGKFDPSLLEAALNEHARLGWDVLAITTASREGFITGGNKDELLVIFYRDLPERESR